MSGKNKVNKVFYFIKVFLLCVLGLGLSLVILSFLVTGNTAKDNTQYTIRESKDGSN